MHPMHRGDWGLIMADLRLIAYNPDLVVRSRDECGARVICVGGEADLQTEHRLSRALRDVMPPTGTPLIVDLTGLTFCSAYALGVLVDMVGSIAHRGDRVAVVGLPAITARVWLLTDVPIPVQYASVDRAVAGLTAAADRAASSVDAEAGTARLLAEVDGLRRALATRAIIEQATGMLMERLTCTSEDAFNLIVLRSRRSARRLHEVAADYLRSGAETAAVHAHAPIADFPSSPGASSEPPGPESAA
jgi:anti-anti-sigma factor